MLVHWIWFSALTGVSDRQKAALLEHFHDPEDIYTADREAIAQTGILTADACEALQSKDLSQAEKILERCDCDGTQLLTFTDAAYPARLRSIPDPPPLLYYKGRLPDLSARPVIGVVGTRKASVYGLSVAWRMGKQISACGAIVASGMAVGIDGSAMLGALEGGMPVVGVLGCGIDIVYPRANRELYDSVIRYGCLLTEFAPGTPPASWNFPRRNRIISGLACGVLVVEAPKKSGALITANLALDQGRDVFVVPENVDVAICEGSNALLRDGAIAVANGWDVVSEYEHLFPGKLGNAALQIDCAPERKKETLHVAQERKNPVPAEKSDKKAVDKAPAKPYSDANTCKIQFSEAERKLLELIGEEPQLVDDVIARSQANAGAVLATLTMLRIKGAVEMLSGGYVRRKQGTLS